MATEAAQVETAQTTDQTTAPAENNSTVATPSPLSTFDYDAINTGYQNGPNVETTNVEQNDAKAGETENAGDDKTTTTPAPAEAVQDTEVDTNNLPDKLRARFSDPEDIAIATLARAKGIPLSKAADIYREQHPAPKEIPGTEATAPEVSPESAEVQRIQGEIETLNTELAKDREESNQLSDESLGRRDRLAELRADLKLAKRDEAQANARTTQTRQDTEEQSRLEAVGRAQAANHNEMVTKFPALNDKESPLTKEVTAVIAEWQADPKLIDHLRQVDAPQRVIKEALFRNPQLGVPAPAQPKAPAAPVSPTAPAPVVRRVNPAPGSQTQVNPGQQSTPAALLKDVGFDPDKAGEALYGDSKGKVALMG